MDSIIEGSVQRNDDLINRLHGIIRPFVLRRLKKDVETQLPGKYEHIVKCQLSRRQVRIPHMASTTILPPGLNSLIISFLLR